MKPQPWLAPLTPLTAAAVEVRNRFFDAGLFRSVDVGVPVISVGNITTGGTGKTPAVKNIVSLLSAEGKRVAVISRGYGRRSRGMVVVSDGKNILADADSAGDEALMIASGLPGTVVIVDEQRVRGAATAVKEYHVDVIVLDDGFQHRHIRRRADIVLIDAHHPPSRTAMLPAGYRREPIRNLRRADAVVITKADDRAHAESVIKSERLPAGIPVFSGSLSVAGVAHLFGGVRQSTDILKGQAGILLSGIARPEQFRRTAISAGLRIADEMVFPDHHRFSENDIQRMTALFAAVKADVIVTTEKDAVRLRPFRDRLEQLPIFAVLVNMEIFQPEQWKEFLLQHSRL